MSQLKALRIQSQEIGMKAIVCEQFCLVLNLILNEIKTP